MQLEGQEREGFSLLLVLGGFFKLEGGAAEIKPAQNGHKALVVSPPGWAAGEHISENLRSLPHTRLVFRSFN